MSYLACDGVIVFSGSQSQTDDISQYECSSGWIIELDNLSFEPAQDLDPVMIASAIGVGFFVLLPLWAAVYGGKMLIKSIQ